MRSYLHLSWYSTQYYSSDIQHNTISFSKCYLLSVFMTQYSYMLGILFSILLCFTTGSCSLTSKARLTQVFSWARRSWSSCLWFGREYYLVTELLREGYSLAHSQFAILHFLEAFALSYDHMTRCSPIKWIKMVHVTFWSVFSLHYTFPLPWIRRLRTDRKGVW